MTTRRRINSKPTAKSNYKVGYGKPPVATRFKPGKSGNPGGRPRGATARPLNEEKLKSIILEEAYRTISVNDANGPLQILLAQAVIRSVAVNAAKGNQRSQRLFTELLSSVEGERKRLHDLHLETAIKYKTDWEIELARRKNLGIKAPDPIPHPDQIIIDMLTGTVHIAGPMTKEETVVGNQQQEDPLTPEERAQLEKVLSELPGMGIQGRARSPRKRAKN